MLHDFQLDYEDHLRVYQNMGALTGNAERDQYWHHEAQNIHTLHVMDAIRNVHIEAANFAATNNLEANLQLKFGVARRTKFIWLSLRSLYSLIQPDRKNPLPHDQVEQAAQDINVIYINIRGTLDNLAWFLLPLVGGKDATRLPPSRVSLFSGAFLSSLNSPAVSEFMFGFRDWNRELSQKRDPAAHRIPLSVPPALLNEVEAKEFHELYEQHARAIEQVARAIGQNSETDEIFDQPKEVFRRMERLGTFLPVFTHHPADRATAIYPTIPQDIGVLVKICNGILKVAGNSLKGAT
jgi:hypothetical protein